MMPLLSTVPIEAPMALAGTEVTGIAGLAGVTIVSVTALAIRMADNHARADERFADAIQNLTTGIHVAVDALKDARVALLESHR